MPGEKSISIFHKFIKHFIPGVASSSRSCIKSFMASLGETDNVNVSKVVIHV